MNKAHEARVLYRNMRELDEELSPYGVTVLQLTFLLTIYETPLISMTLSANAMGLASSSITSLVDLCESKGLVRRTKHPGDRRVYCLELTEKSAELLKTLLEEKVPV